MFLASQLYASRVRRSFAQVLETPSRGFPGWCGLHVSSTLPCGDTSSDRMLPGSEVTQRRLGGAEQSDVGWGRKWMPEQGVDWQLPQRCSCWTEGSNISVCSRLSIISLGPYLSAKVFQWAKGDINNNTIESRLFLFTPLPEYTERGLPCLGVALPTEVGWDFTEPCPGLSCLVTLTLLDS